MFLAIALMSTVAMAQSSGPPPQSDSAAVTLTIEEYAEIEITDTATLEVTGGASSATDTVTYELAANFVFDLDATITDTGSDDPGDYYVIDLTPAHVAAGTPAKIVDEGPAQVSTAGTLTVGVENITHDQGVTNDGATLTLTVSKD
jgi:hypothetical protein